MYGLTFNNEHSYTKYGLVVVSKKISTPSKKKITLDVPYMNSCYDFSTIGSNGEIVYNKRNIEVDFALLSSNKKELQTMITKAIEWLQDSSSSKLIFDDMPDYYFMAELEEEIEITSSTVIGEFTVKFIAEPFKTGVSVEGTEKAWDTFNFEEDYLQESVYTVSGSKTITIYNTGRLVMPTINCSAAMTATFNGKTYTLYARDNDIYNFKLANGANSITVNGTGTIKFIWRKVSL